MVQGREIEKQLRDESLRRTPHLLIAVFVILAMGIMVAGAVSFINYEKQYRHEVDAQLSAIGALKAAGIKEWLDSFLNKAATFNENPAFASLVKRYLASPWDTEAQAQLRAWISEACTHLQFDKITLMDSKGYVRLAMPSSSSLTAYAVRQRALEVISTRKMELVDFYRSEDDGKVYLAILVPVIDPQDHDHTLGVLTFRIDPEKYLYPYIMQWPVPSASAETLLVRRDGGHVLFLNEVRFRKGSALSLRIPLVEKVPAVMAVLGHTGIVEGRDYRGVSVIADIGPVPGTGWFYVARRDRDEVYEPLRKRLWLTVFMSVLMLLGAGSMLGYVWRKQSLDFLKESLEQEKALKDTEIRFKALFQQSPIAIGLYDASGNLVSVNRSCLDLFGIDDQRHIMGFRLFEDPNVSDENKARLRDGKEIHYQAGFDFDKVRSLNLYPTSRQGIVWLDVLITPLVSALDDIEGFLVQVQDITERRKAEELLRESERKFRLITESISDVVLIIDSKGMYRYVSPSHKKILGRGEEVLGQSAFDHIHPDDVARILEAYRDGIEKKSSGNAEYRYLHPTRGYIWIESQGVATEIDGEVCGIIATRDITERVHAETRMRESEERYRRLFEFMVNGFALHEIICDDNGNPVDYRFLEVNPAFERLTGLHEKDLIQRTVLEVLPDTEPFWIKRYGKVALTGEPAYFESYSSVLDKYFEVIAYATGKGRFAVIFSDISERKRAEAMVRESEERFRQMFENMSNCVAVYEAGGDGEDFIIRDFNRAAEHTEKVRREDIVGRSVREVFPGVVDFGVFAVFQRVWRTGKPEAHPISVYKDDRIEGWRESFVYKLSSGEVVAIYSDVTARKQAEEALRDSEEKYRLLADFTYDWEYWLGPDKKYIYVSTSCERITGYSAREFYEDPGIFIRIAHPDDREQMKAHVDEAIDASHDVRDIEFRIISRAGDVRWINHICTPVFLKDGTYAGRRGSNRDITERKKTDEILKEKNAELERFTYTVSHDLKSPLVTVKTFLGYLKEDLEKGDKARVETDMEFMRTAADKMGRLLDELLEMSRIGRVTNAPVRMTFRDIVDEALGNVAGLIMLKGVAVEVDWADIVLLGDRARLSEIWQNLIENAVKFMGGQAEPCIEIGAEPKGRDTVFFVRDNGMGIEPQYQDKVFGLFDKLSPGTEGTGLGLALISRIIELYNGRIWVESEGRDKGSCFRFTLPDAVQAE